MENKELSLHEQKVIILGRLIKETTLTLEEALLLLKEEEQPTVISTGPQPTHYNPWIHTTQPWTSSGSTLKISTYGNVGIGTTSDGSSTVSINNMADATL